MSRMKLLFGIMIIAALITAGCTGMKTMAGNENLPAAGQSAQADYQKYSGELKDEVNYLQNHYKLSPNATLDEYSAWLSGLSDRITLCRQMYNNTTTASKTYLAYLNNSSDEYRNVTSDNALLASAIETLNRSYDTYRDNLNMSVKKMAALEEYSDDLNVTTAIYNDIGDYTKNAKISSADDYGRFVDGFNKKAGQFDASANRTVDAGENYLQYLTPGSDEYKAVQANDKALEDSVRQCWDAYRKYKNDYDGKLAAKNAAQGTFTDYVTKVNKVTSVKKDLDTYYGSAKALDKLNGNWLNGYKQKVDAYDAACNDAINAGHACEKYLDPSSSDYKSVSTNEKNMRDSMASYDNSYKGMYTTYQNLHPLGNIK